MASNTKVPPTEHSISADPSDDKRGKAAESQFLSQFTTNHAHLADSLEPHDSYEGKHRWDPGATWDPSEEATVVRKTDLYLLTWICVMFFGLQLGKFQSSNLRCKRRLTHSQTGATSKML